MAHKMAVGHFIKNQYYYSIVQGQSANKKPPAGGFLRSVQSKMVLFQGFADSYCQNGSEDNGNNCIEYSGGDFADNGHHGGIRCQAVLENTAPVVGFCQICSSIGNCTGRGCDGRLHGTPVVFPKQHYKTREQTVSTLHQKGHPCLGHIHGIGHIIKEGSQTGGQSAQPGSQENAGKGAHDVAQVEGCGSGNINRHGDPYGGTDYGQGGHQCCQNDPFRGYGLLFIHEENLLAWDCYYYSENW